jgi:hypothetical protein
MVKMKLVNFFFTVLLVLVSYSSGRAQIGMTDSIFVCGTTSKGEIFVFEKGQWQQIEDNTLSKITVTNKGIICGVDFMGTLWRRVGDYGWQIYPLSKTVTDLSIVKAITWFIDDSSNTFYFNTRIAKIYPANIKLKSIDVGMNGNVAGISPDGKLYKADFLPAQFTNGPFEEIPFEQKFIDAAAGEVIYAVTEKGELYCCASPAGAGKSQPNWTKIDSKPLTRIDVDCAGTLWAIAKDGKALSYSSNEWKKYDVKLAEIAASGFISK